MHQRLHTCHTISDQVPKRAYLDYEAFYDRGSPYFFSGVPHLRISIPHPKTDYSKNQICVSMNNSIAQVYKNAFFQNNNSISTILG